MDSWYYIPTYTPQGIPAPYNNSLTAYIRNNESPDPYTTVFFSPDNGANGNNFKWQLLSVRNPPNGSYILRSQAIIGGFLSSFDDRGPDTTSAKCSTQLGVNCSAGVRLCPYINLNSVWNVTATGDGTDTFYMSNAQNGSGYHFDTW